MRECRSLPSTAVQHILQTAAGFARRSTLRTAALAGVTLALLAGIGLKAQTPDRITQPVNASRVQELAHHHPLWANPANDAGAVPADLQLNQLTLVLARTPQQEQALEQLLADQQNPASPHFHRWLTAAQMGQRFGISDHDLGAVRAWLESEGLRVNWIAPGRNFIGFGGAAADVNRAFQTELHFYNVNGAKRLSVASDPMIPQALAPVITAVRGLYSLQDRPSHLTQLMKSTPDFSNGGNHFIAPGDFATIYDLPTEPERCGRHHRHRWLVVRRPRRPAEFPPADRDQLRRSGRSGAHGIRRRQSWLALYSAAQLLQQLPGRAGGSHARCGARGQRGPGRKPAAGSFFAESGANDGIGAAAQYLIQTSPVPAQIVNISFGDCEADAGPSGVSYWNKLFEQAAAEGISVIVSSGDSGAAGCDTSFAAPPDSPQAVSPNYICASTYATCVGGTDFNDASNRRHLLELG